MAEYELQWKRSNTKPRPEDELDVQSRQDAVEEILEDIGISKDEYDLKPSKRVLGGDLPYFEIANLVLFSVDIAIRIKSHIENKGDDAVIGDDLKKRLDEEYKQTLEE